MDQLKTEQLSEKLLTILCTHLKFADDPQSISANKRLDELGLDSMGAINLLLDLEDSFEISFPDYLLTEETFRTAGTLSQAVQSLINQ